MLKKFAIVTILTLLVLALMLSAVTWMSSGLFRELPVPVEDCRRAVTDSGVSVVEAIHAHRNRTELFPEKLTDLDGAPPEIRQTEKWRYQWWPWGWRIEHAQLPVSYESHHGYAGWFVRGREEETKLEVPMSLGERAARSEEESYRLVTAEIERRIARDPRNPLHHKGLISHRMRRGDFESALKDAERMHRLKLYPWWERQVLCRILHRLGRENWAEREMIAEAESRSGFLPFFYLAMFHRAAGNFDRVCEFLERASGCPLDRKDEDKGDTSYTDDFYFWTATKCAYAGGRHALVMRLCELWRWQGYDDAERSAMLAAASLALKDLLTARKQIAIALSVEADHAIWARGLKDLKRAIDAEDSSFHWDPGDFPDHDLLISYE